MFYNANKQDFTVLNLCYNANKLLNVLFILVIRLNSFILCLNTKSFYLLSLYLSISLFFTSPFLSISLSIYLSTRLSLSYSPSLPLPTLHLSPPPSRFIYYSLWILTPHFSPRQITLTPRASAATQVYKAPRVCQASWAQRALWEEWESPEGMANPEPWDPRA